MLETIQKIIADKMDIDASIVTPESTFADLKIDSLDMVEIVMDLEAEFDVTIEKSEGLSTVGDLMSYIESLKS